MKYRLQQCLNSFNGPSTEKRMNIDANKKKFIGLICIFDPGHPRHRHYIICSMTKQFLLRGIFTCLFMTNSELLVSGDRLRYVSPWLSVAFALHTDQSHLDRCKRCRWQSCCQPHHRHHALLSVWPFQPSRGSCWNRIRVVMAQSTT